MEALNFVPKYPVLGYVLLSSGLLGLPLALQALASSGGSLRTRLAGVQGLLLAAAIATLTLLKGNNLFVWHVIGMSFGVFALQPAALHAILAKRSCKDVEGRKSRVKQHKLLQIAVIGSVIVGFLAIYMNKPAGFPGKHFMSVHSLVGLAALLLMGWNVLDAAYRQGNPIKPQLLWSSWLHRTAGTLAFTLSLSAAALGLFNRTVVVDWAASPIHFSLPETWNEMNGWAKSTHGEPLAWVFIASALLLLLQMLFPGAAASVDKAKKT